MMRGMEMVTSMMPEGFDIRGNGCMGSHREREPSTMMMDFLLRVESWRMGI